ncbi:RelA/SpoT domain-containing protein [Catenovulum agarivorans]|uniref:RelA/SpoT domain-containing protein n=1 Tax=Catenovulum agarivorans TaxID=1172192 RepID=UPI0002D83848|nr:RelA/SpoT domain-containing protein [Catenovulum agarivorans]
MINDLDGFCTRLNISKDDWNRANISLDSLNLILQKHADNTAHLNEAAEFLAKMLQKCPQVHSVRWRIKDPEHLAEKIIRKRMSGVKKYLEINENNYSELVTDLVGVRVLHLFKYEWLDIHGYILNYWTPLEGIKAYIREGDEASVVKSYEQNKCEVETHPSGYRSIHYIISTQPTIKKIISEIQVRTIFEEAWSEIDHRVRYPNFSNHKLLSYFLTIFNKIAGNADEMGTFVKELTAEINVHEARIAQVKASQEEHLSKIEELASALSNEKEQHKSMSENLRQLQLEVRDLRETAQLSGEHLYAERFLKGNPVLSNLDSVAGLGLSHSMMLGLGLSPSTLSVMDALGAMSFETRKISGLGSASSLGEAALDNDQGVDLGEYKFLSNDSDN